MRQFLAESLMISFAGCVAGVLLGKVVLQILLAAAPAAIPRIQAVSIDWRIFAVAAVTATVTGLVFGMAPAWQASSASAGEAMKSGQRSTAARPVMRWRAVLTSAEVALSMILLIGAGLLLRSFVTLIAVDLGFRTDRVIAMNINLPKERYGSGEERLRFFQRLEERVRALPGVEAAAYANRMPMRGGWGGGVYADVAPETVYDMDRQAVNPGYFETLGLKLLRGRLLTSEDRSGGPGVVVVSQALVRKMFGEVDPIGHRIKNGGEAPWATIVGVVGDMRRDGKQSAITGQVYLPAAQPELYAVVPLADFAVRSAGDPHELVNAIQGEVLSLDKDQPITRVRTLEEIVSNSVAQTRFETVLLVMFAGLAVGMAMIGVFGVLSYAVGQRMGEFGIRMALGAEPVGIMRMVLRQAGVLIACGAAAGLAGGYGLSRFVASMLFQVKPHDEGTYVGAMAVLAAVSVAAALIPARRAARIEPIVAMRYE
jgi:predicted permease